MAAIEICGLAKNFKLKRGVVEALKGISLEVSEGEVFGFLGPNGAGKSTTIKVLMGLIQPSAGNARIMGQPVTSHLSRKEVGYLPENPAFYEFLTAEEYLAFVGAAFGMTTTGIRTATDNVLKLLDLWDARKRSIRGYSKGMVQRLGLAQVLLHDPDVYILDEPMSGLDPIGRALVKDIILDLKKRGKCVFFSTHITADVETVCDRVGIITQGVLRSVEQVQTILTKGVVGYHVRLKSAENEQTTENYVARDEVSEYLADACAKGMEIVLIEPKRKNLEEFFLDIVKAQ